MNPRWTIVRTLALGCIGAAVSSQALAQAPGNFPAKPPRILVGFVPGGFTDLAGRMVAQELSEVFGMQVVVDNRPGANGAIAADLTARAVGALWVQAGGLLGGRVIDRAAPAEANPTSAREKRGLSVPAYSVHYSDRLPLLIRDINKMIQAWESGYWDWNLDHACAEYGGCPFKSVCQMREPMQLLTQQFQRRRWDPVQRTETVLDSLD